MKDRVKKMGKDAMVIGMTGVGLGVMGSVGGGAAIGTLGRGLGAAGGLVMVSHGLGILQESIPKKKKRGGY